MRVSHKQDQFQDMITKALDQRFRQVSRRSMLKTTAIGGTGLVAATFLGGSAFAQDSTPDAEMDMDAESPFEGPADVINYALTLEHLETAFYRDGLAEFGVDAFTDLDFQSSVFDRLGDIADHEATHVETLVSVVESLGGTPVEEAEYAFPYTDAASFIEFAQVLEDVGVTAYQGAAIYLMEEPELLTAALTIHGVEARHAAYLAVLNGGNPFPDVVNPSRTPEEVLEIATPLFVM
ncbi:MAG: ferritin-like domain-containing protein [Thermomicrobiales bacterium]